MPRSVDGAEALLFRLPQQRRCQRHVDDVGDDGLWRQARKVDRRRRLAVHAERGRVDEEAGTGNDLGKRRHRMCLHRRAEAIGQFPRPLGGAVHHMDRLDPGPGCLITARLAPPHRESLRPRCGSHPLAFRPDWRRSTPVGVRRAGFSIFEPEACWAAPSSALSSSGPIGQRKAVSLCGIVTFRRKNRFFLP